MAAIKSIQVTKFDINKPASKNIYCSQMDMTANEVPIALIYNGISHVVMMTTPKDLEYFAIGFSLSEQIIYSLQDIYGIDISPTAHGIEIQIEISSRCFMQLKEKRRNLSGRTGCGICGSEQLQQIYQDFSALPVNQFFNLHNLASTPSYLKYVQNIGQLTGCTHATIWIDLQGNFIAGFEDVGRHVALDKLLGYRAKQMHNNLHDGQGIIVISSRASYEMVQKAVVCGVEVLCAVSAATVKAIEMANQANLTLIGFFHGNTGVIYSGMERIIQASATN